MSDNPWTTEIRYAWQRDCVAALTEIDPNKRMQLLGDAEADVLKRLQSWKAGDDEERQALYDALDVLRLVKGPKP